MGLLKLNSGSGFLQAASTEGELRNNKKMKRLGFVGIIIEEREKKAALVNALLSQHSNLILARTGLPNAKGDTSIITLVIDATTDELGLLTGKLGNITGVSVKSGLAKN